MNDSNENILVCKNVQFFSDEDKNAFFEWVEKIDCVEKTSGTSKELHLHVAADDIHEYDLRDLLGFLYRYNIDMKQLQRFLTDENKGWFFDNKRAYWHKLVFGKENE